MRGIAAVIVGVMPILAMTQAHAQGSAAGSAAPFQGTVRARPVAPVPFTPPRPIPPKIGTFHGLPVRVWAPVEQPYNRRADRNGAADPILPAIPWWRVLPPMNLSS